MDKNAMFREFLENISDMDPKLIDSIEQAFGAVYESEEDMSEEKAAEALASNIEVDEEEVAEPKDEKYVATGAAHGKYANIINGTYDVLTAILGMIREFPEMEIIPWAEVVSEDLYTAMQVGADKIDDQIAEMIVNRLDAASDEQYKAFYAKGPKFYTFSLKKKGKGE